MVWHIFKKDWKLLWPLAIAVESTRQWTISRGS